MKKLSLLGISMALLFLTGCITIFEKYKFNKDGSGSMEYIIDMSELYEMMGAFSDSTEEIETSDMDVTLREALPELEKIPGITKVELTGDITKYVAGIRFDFKDVIALNKALAIVLENEEGSVAVVKYVEFNGKTFIRNGQTSHEFNKEDLLGSEELDEESTKMIMEGMKYNISVEFQKPVKKVTSLANYTIENNSVTVEATLSEIFDNSDFMKTTIKTK